MSEYDFLVLSPDEFELFCKDILEVELGIKFENFKAGKDGGIDIRYAPSDDGCIIVQCKRYKDFSNLKGTLKKEVEKVKLLSPNRYILMTSVPLSPSEKDSIMQIFDGYIKSTGDIYGKDELQTILRNHHAVERKHFKLWLSSTNMLNTILHNDIYNRSQFTEEQIKEKVRLYVRNESFDIALKHLEKNKVIILSGGPGVGKTTLADMLFLKYSADGYEFIEISNDIEEGEKLYNPEIKQVFYYDDFLGRNFLNDKLSKNEDRRIINFITKVIKSENKIFIMTTREYILNQAKINYELFEDKKIEINKFILNVENYTKIIKAKILYNHLFFSNIPSEFLQSFVIKRMYKKVIEHPNYNPRLINRMTLELDFNDIMIEEYEEYFLNELDNPFYLWQHIFENQINDYSRWLLKLLMIMGDKEVSLAKLENNFNPLNIFLGRPYEVLDFRKGLKELEKSFIKIYKSIFTKEDVIWFINPSIADFLIQYHSGRRDIVTLWNSTKYFFKMFDIFSFSKIQGKIEVPKDMRGEYYITILNRFDEFDDCRLIYNKIQAISRLDKYIDFSNGIAKEILVKVFQTYEVDDSEEFVELLVKYKEVLSSELEIKIILTNLLDKTEYIYEAMNLLNLYDYYEEELDEIIKKIDNEKLLKDVVDDIITNATTEYEFEEVVDIVKELGEILNIDVSNEIELILEKYNEIEEEMYIDSHLEYERNRENNDDLENEDHYVDNLFESLLH